MDLTWLQSTIKMIHLIIPVSMQLQMALHEGLRNKDYLVKWSVIF